MKKDILVVLVVYEKVVSELNLFKNFIAINPDLDVLVYDNSNKSQLDDIGLSNIYYIHDKTNPGVSKAYNEGAKYAVKKKKKAILLLDQDSVFSDNYLIEYENKFSKYGDGYIYAPLVVDRNKTKVYSPARLERFVGHVIPYSRMSRASLCSLKGMSVINSGLLIPLAVFDRVGGFNEKIKLDFSDVFFIERYKEVNASIVLVDVEMEHSLSGDEEVNFEREISRFYFYCNGAKELSKSLRSSTLWSVFRRMLSLTLKYRSLLPFIHFIKFYFCKVTK